MISVNFYLDKPNDKKDTRILLSLSFNGKRIKIPTGLSIDPKYWDPKRQRAKPQYSLGSKINKAIGKKDELCVEAYVDAIGEGTGLTREYFQEKMAPVLPNDFYKEYEDYISVKSVQQRPNTIKKHRTTINVIREFEKATGYKVTFESINNRFYDAIINFLVNTKINSRDGRVGLFNNTIFSYIKRLKIFLAYALENGLTKNDEFKKFKVFEEDIEVICYSREELEEIQSVDLNGNKRLENVRDLFLLESYTGLRYSDIFNLKPENIVGDQLIITTQKTKERLSLPLSLPATKIITKFLAGDVQPISPQKMNKYLKELCKLAGFTQPISIVRYSGSTRIEQLIPKCELSTSHVGRKSFVTIHLTEGVPPHVVMALSGHKSEREFRKYINISDQIKRKELDRVWG